MQSSLERLNLQIGYLKLSEKKKIEELLLAERDREQLLLKEKGGASGQVFSELKVLTDLLFKLYQAEKGKEGNDRLFAAGHEVAELLRRVGLFPRFEQMLLQRFNQHYSEKARNGETSGFYLGKASALIDGLGSESLQRFQERIAKFRLDDLTENQTDLVGGNPKQMRTNT